jgi:hypothetical protein
MVSTMLTISDKPMTPEDVLELNKLSSELMEQKTGAARPSTSNRRRRSYKAKRRVGKTHSVRHRKRL